MTSLKHKLLQIIRSQLGKRRPLDETAGMAAPVATGLALDEQGVHKLMDMLAKTREVEYTCEEAFAQLDEFVELVADDEEAAALMPLVQHHVELCPDCRERFVALLEILKSEPPL